MIRKAVSSRTFGLTGSLFLYASLAQSAVLYSDTIILTAADPVQVGRISRDGIPSDWTGDKLFPGIINPATAYHYQAVSVEVPNWLSYLQISVDSNNTAIFASAYDGSYNPDFNAPNNGLDINYLGDEGSSGNFFGNPAFFQIVDWTAVNSPSGFGTLLVVLNTTSVAGLDSPVGLLVEGFSNTAYDEIPPDAGVPEPATFWLLGISVLALGSTTRKRLQP